MLADWEFQNGEDPQRGDGGGLEELGEVLCGGVHGGVGNSAENSTREEAFPLRCDNKWCFLW